MERSNWCEKVLTIKDVKHLALKWSFNTPEELFPSPAVAHGVGQGNLVRRAQDYAGLPRPAWPFVRR